MARDDASSVECRLARRSWNRLESHARATVILRLTNNFPRRRARAAGLIRLADNLARRRRRRVRCVLLSSIFSSFRPRRNSAKARKRQSPIAGRSESLPLADRTDRRQTERERDRDLIKHFSMRRDVSLAPRSDRELRESAARRFTVIPGRYFSRHRRAIKSASIRTRACPGGIRNANGNGNAIPGTKQRDAGENIE